MNEDYSKIIKEEVDRFFKKTTFQVDSDVVFTGEVFFIKIKAEDSKILIGERGQTLIEIQRLLRLLTRKRLQDEVLIEVDINDYKAKKEKALKDVARDIADEVVFYKKEKILPPMSSYERRIIHMALKDREGIETESVGNYPERKIVVKPV